MAWVASYVCSSMHWLTVITILLMAQMKLST